MVRCTKISKLNIAEPIFPFLQIDKNVVRLNIEMSVAYSQGGECCLYLRARNHLCGGLLAPPRHIEKHI